MHPESFPYDCCCDPRGESRRPFDPAPVSIAKVKSGIILVTARLHGKLAGAALRPVTSRHDHSSHCPCSCRRVRERGTRVRHGYGTRERLRRSNGGSQHSRRCQDRSGRVESTASSTCQMRPSFAIRHPSTVDHQPSYSEAGYISGHRGIARVYAVTLPRQHVASASVLES